MKYALDTNTLIYFFKGMGEVATRLLDTPPHEIGVPAVVVYELEVGIAKSTSAEKRRAQLDELLSMVRILPFSASEATRTAQIRVDLERKGIPIGPLDLLIAGTALVANLTLVTHNLKEFSRVRGLNLVDWFEP
jgi:tRNA(fMet)-specific endonuclease VapC